jgi:type II secretory pathway pseudopilin PulG
MSLIEVVLAMAILGGALAILGEIIQLADRNAADAQALQNAQLHAESVIDELQSGARALTDVAEEPLDAEARPPWLLTLTLGTSNIAGVAPVEIEVRQDLPDNLRPVRYRLTRWFSTLSATAADAQAAPAQASGEAASGATR